MTIEEEAMNLLRLGRQKQQFPQLSAVVHVASTAGSYRYSQEFPLRAKAVGVWRKLRTDWERGYVYGLLVRPDADPPPVWGYMSQPTQRKVWRRVQLDAHLEETGMLVRDVLPLPVEWLDIQHVREVNVYGVPCLGIVLVPRPGRPRAPASRIVDVVRGGARAGLELAVNEFSTSVPTSGSGTRSMALQPDTWASESVAGNTYWLCSKRSLRDQGSGTQTLIEFRHADARTEIPETVFERED